MFVLGLSATVCGAQSYPVKPIELVSPTGAGGGSDLVARTVADIITREKLLPQPLVVQNKPGGGGAVGQTYVAAKKGDPYTILLAGTTLITVPLRTGLEVGLDKFQPLGMIGVDLNSLAVREDSPYKTVKDLVAAREGESEDDQHRHDLPRRQRAQHGVSAGNSSPAPSSTSCRSRAARNGYGGPRRAHPRHGGESRRSHAACRGEKLRLLGVPAMKRPAGLPDVPTLKEQGFDIHAGGYRCVRRTGGHATRRHQDLGFTLEKVHKSAAWKTTWRATCTKTST